MKYLFPLLALPLMAQEPSPLVIAHRGASGYLPEHTLEAKAMAHAQGAASIEQDVVLTKDDVPVVLHDIHVDTISDVATRFPGRQREDGRFYALDFTLAELKQLKATTQQSVSELHGVLQQWNACVPVFASESAQLTKAI
ncbi:MAG: glycerophosphodiester phosphodiesterase family protein, partial [Verrucomicrobiota bacterium]